MRPKTMASGIFNTKRSSAVSVSRLTRMFVPKPKKAFQSPGTQNLGLNVFITVSFRFGFGVYGGDINSPGRIPFCGGTGRIAALPNVSEATTVDDRLQF